MEEPTLKTISDDIEKLARITKEEFTALHTHMVTKADLSDFGATLALEIGRAVDVLLDDKLKENVTIKERLERRLDEHLASKR